ncbi:hypothetical protein GCM10010174_28510 [Kutzneria viridogrisea]|uniref:Secreted protein n=2 Tax=Kutzneria TaxID=43356 RepID=A0ABR6BU24_9PSEU|nr:hypothetical protein [Kutzneria albida]AHH94458.1 putative membrane protein [Kutzneria albida DSM 43870]MBA8930126.1 hypothetical protein [Kutzneria viridogrisea]
MNVNWFALAEVLVVGLGTVACVVILFATGIRGMSQRVVARAQGGTGSAGLTVAVSCFSACSLIVLYGLYLIVSH